MGEAAARVSMTALGQSQALEGTMCISASETYAAVLLPPIIAKLRILEPSIQVEIVVANHASDLRRREADIAIRNFRPTEPDLRHADFVNMDHGGMMIKGLNTLGLGLTEANYPLLTEGYLVMWELVRHGAAIGVLNAYIGDTDPVVRRVLPDLEPLVFPIWLVSHRELTKSRRIRRVYDFLVEELHRG